MSEPVLASAESLHAFMHQYVPLARAAEINVESYDGRTLTISAPLAANINDKGTAFGGSLYNLCVIAGWGMTALLSKELDLLGDLVVAKAEIEYLRPLRSELRATVERPSEEQLAHFVESYQRKGRASMQHEISVLDEAGKSCVAFHAKYAIVAAKA